MKTIENITIYKCDFCKKELKRKHAMEKHELQCNLNPINLRPCLNGCGYLERKPVVLGIGRNDYFSGEEITKEYNGFFCSLKQIYLIHPKAEYKNEFIKSEATYDTNDIEIFQESMPKECLEFNYNFNF